MEGFDWGIVPEPQVDPVGVQDLTFDGLLKAPLKIDSDGGAAGCGGKLWPAGDLLARWLIRNPPKPNCKVLELGSGTGLSGLALAAATHHKVYITDQANMVPLMQRNIDINGLGDYVEAAELDWGEPLPDYAKDIGLVLAADCVYLEAAFPLLENTLLQLTAETDVPILMAYKKRRKADRHFFKAIKKHFVVTELSDFPEFEKFHRENVHLFTMARKSSD